MLNSLRSGGSNAFVWLILILLIVGLAGFGIGGSGGGGASTPVAAVGDSEVTVDEYVRAFNEQNQRFSQQFGRALSPQEMALFGLDQLVISQLLNGAALDGEAAKLGISVGDETVRDRLLRNPAFRGVDGAFNQDAYTFALNRAGIEPSEYDDILRNETTRQLLQASIMAGVDGRATAAEAFVAFIGQKRALEWVRLNASHLEYPVGAPGDADLQAYYEANEAEYTLPETRDVTYAYATEALLLDQIDISEDELRALYDERVDEFRSPARRIVDRIVFGTEEEALAALARIEEGVDGFEEIAQERGLSAQDTDLGEVTENDLNAEERALLFGSTDLGVVGPVPSDLGPAIYRINAILDETLVTFEDARRELNEELASDRAADLIAAEVEEIEDLVAGGATLEELAAETLLELGTITMTAETDEGIAADESFREEALLALEGQERDLFNLSDGVAILRVDRITDPKLQPLEEVRAAVAEAWRLDETARQITDLGNVLKDRIDAGESIGDIAATYSLILTEEAPLGRNGIIEDTPPEFVAAVFDAELGKAFVVPDGGSVLLGRVTEIVPADMESDDAIASVGQFEQELNQATATDIFAYFTQALQDAEGVSVNQSLIQNIQSQLGAQ